MRERLDVISTRRMLRQREQAEMLQRHAREREEDRELALLEVAIVDVLDPDRAEKLQQQIKDELRDEEQDALQILKNRVNPTQRAR